MVTVVGIGADGWAGLAGPARDALASADVIVGVARQLALLPEEIAADRVEWPSPLVPAIPAILDAHRDRALCVLASGDPMFYGIGATLARRTELRVISHPSSASLVCARLGWALEDVEVVSAVARPVVRLHAVVHHGRRVLVLSENSTTPLAVARLLTARGFGASRMTVVSSVGGPDEQLVSGIADDWSAAVGALNIVAVECVAAPEARRLPRTPGLPDDTYEHDGQITKREIRAVTVAALSPEPGLLLWDIGAGSGSVGIEWMRSHPSCRAIAVEPRADRAERIIRNANRLGVPGLRVVHGSAPDALEDLPDPDVVFVGGGVTVEGVIAAGWAALRPGGRLVVNAVTLESEALVTRWRADLGGDLIRLAISRAAPLGAFTAWRPMLPVTQWTVVKENQ
ncbi:bifunctional cobalt-precorrin-7 (C(5))-methyltransferase/cobalt-precorrin-6B (C(15))-methyltransferase [Alloactinosynnema sp. L-07]|uniref:bifunctional cobalt-precorrin-7 (C(5))-methyltransferase/cobalt-precorrin-6B (C(15))-methyltransferase n=1 Tax=Alloactinosynnema sp. L-07 TaxID=1653480 RepID=UPI0006B49B88|nr:bifunctional cobalt-precorrin-7 (C(5))-methyltransferase/cobalt-precorrin-6B (C(15))-methyltransferase [Alloactinosynnema sp. L-07]